jgi:SWI/SNF-related matrix-associated actin-dependent regulator 1 of chromatin subfamily A
MKFNYLVLDEGHMVKNIDSLRFKHLASIKVRIIFNFQTPNRLLLTGTPVRDDFYFSFKIIFKNLLNFVMPDVFESHCLDVSKFRNYSPFFKDLVEKIKKIMVPFILRRKKIDVLNHY